MATLPITNSYRDFNPLAWNPSKELIGIFRNTDGNYTYFQGDRRIYFAIPHDQIAFSYYHFHPEIASSIPDESFIIGLLYSAGDIQFMVSGKALKSENRNKNIARLREIREEVSNNYTPGGPRSSPSLSVRRKRVVTINQLNADPIGKYAYFDNKKETEVVRELLGSEFLGRIKTNQVNNADSMKPETFLKVGAYLYLNSRDDVRLFLTNLGEVLGKTDPNIVGVCAVKFKLIKKRFLCTFNSSKHESKKDESPVRNHTVKELKMVAKQRGLIGYSKLRKLDLLKVLKKQ